MKQWISFVDEVYNLGEREELDLFLPDILRLFP